MAARYREIATDICEAVLKSKPIEGFDRKGTARVTMAMAIGESALAKDADVGPCYRKKPYRTRCDGGLAVGVLQVQLPPRQRKAYFLDRDLLVGRALRGLRGSFAACRNNPINERLAAYASGSCTREAGKRASRRRWKLVQRVLVWSK